MPARGESSSGNTRMDLGLVPYWTLDKYCRERASSTDMKGLDAMPVGGKNFVMFDRILFKYDMILGAW